MSYAKPFQPFGSIVEPGLAQQNVCKQTAAHADLAMNAPHRQRYAFLIQRRFPCKDVLIHAVDQRAVEIEEKGGFIACHARRAPRWSARPVGNASMPHERWLGECIEFAKGPQNTLSKRKE